MTSTNSWTKLKPFSKTKLSDSNNPSAHPQTLSHQQTTPYHRTCHTPPTRLPTLLTPSLPNLQPTIHQLSTSTLRNLKSVSPHPPFRYITLRPTPFHLPIHPISTRTNTLPHTLPTPHPMPPRLPIPSLLLLRLRSLLRPFHLSLHLHLFPHHLPSTPTFSNTSQKRNSSYQSSTPKTSLSGKICPFFA